MSNEINGKRIVFLVAPRGVEHAELTATWTAVREAGGTPVLVTTAGASVATSKETLCVDRLAGDLIASGYDALVLPGGVENSFLLRGNAEAVRLVVDFVVADKPVAAIAHGGAARGGRGPCRESCHQLARTCSRDCRCGSPMGRP